MITTWSEVLSASFGQLWTGSIAFLPKLIVAILVFVLGWVIASLVGDRVVAPIIRAFKTDKALRALGVEEPLAKAGFRLDSGAFIGALVRWFLIVVFLIASLDILGLSEVNAFLNDVVLNYLPKVIAASLILVVAAFVADIMRRVVVGSAKAADVPSADLLGGVVKWSIWIFAILVALYHLGIAGVFAQTLFTGFVAMLAIGGGLAFGLGGKDVAARYLDKLKRDMGAKD